MLTCIFAAQGGIANAQKAPINPATPQVPAIQASSAILVDADTGQVLFQKNADVLRPPASTTKVMTAILLLENLKPDDVLTASKRAADTGGSSLNLKAGEKITARDMLYALMLRSANDGCVVVAERIAGSEQKFADMMTRKAQEIGAVNTRFSNCNGLNDNPNVTTARDLATMARFAFRYPEFNTATRSKYYNVTHASDNKDTLLKNHAKFLWQFPGADGVKTGYTNPAGHCFVGAATWNGWRLVSVVLHSPDIVHETAALMKYGFQTYEVRKVVEPGQSFGAAVVQGGSRQTVEVASKEAIRYIIPRGADPVVEIRPRIDTITAPVIAGTRAGIVEAWSGGRMIGRTPLVASTAVERAAVLSASGAGGEWFIFGAVAGTVLIGYGTTIAKASRIRRYRLKALLRDIDRGGPGFR